MLFYIMIMLMLIRVTLAKSNAGTAIFHNKHTRADCWNNDDIIKLRARRTFERLIPPRANPDDINEKYIKNVLRYFHRALYSMDNVARPHTLTLLKESLSDTIGAHLRSEVLPAVRFAYYAGYVSYRDARQIHDFYDDIKAYLNTQGLGWKKPKRTSQNWSNLTVAKILIGAGTLFDPCACLIMKRDNNTCIHLPIPKHDDEQEPTAIALPFKSGGLIGLSSPDSKNALLKYYTTASRCILSSSPEKCRHTDFISFNNALWHWMKREVAPHLVDETLYAAYGGVLRIAASVQNYGKGLSRRNLFEDQDSGFTKWHPWQSLTQSYLYINADWTPQVYICLVIMTAVSIYLLQICYSYIFGNSEGCDCTGRAGFFSRNLNNGRVAVMPNQQSQESAVYYSENKRNKQPHPKSKTPWQASIKTQKVYDLNNNTEKLMAVMMSSNDDSLRESTSSGSSFDGRAGVAPGKPRSPPQLETSISQLTIDRRVVSQCQLPCVGGTRTRTVSDTHHDPNTSDSQCSTSESSTSSRSRSSCSSKSRRSRSSRDLEWVRKVISKQSLRSGTKSAYKHDPDRIPSNPNSRR